MDFKRSKKLLAVLATCYWALALLIYLVGAWLIRRIKKGLSRMFIRRNTEKALASFVMSFTTIGLTILLIIITISTQNGKRRFTYFIRPH